jgi:hypothetical protein
MKTGDGLHGHVSCGRHHLCMVLTHKVPSGSGEESKEEVKEVEEVVGWRGAGKSSLLCVISAEALLAA